MMLQSLQMSAYQVLETEKEWPRIPSDIQVSWDVFFPVSQPCTLAWIGATRPDDNNDPKGRCLWHASHAWEIVAGAAKLLEAARSLPLAAIIHTKEAWCLEQFNFWSRSEVEVHASVLFCVSCPGPPRGPVWLLRRVAQHRPSHTSFKSALASMAPCSYWQQRQQRCTKAIKVTKEQSCTKVHKLYVLL